MFVEELNKIYNQREDLCSREESIEESREESREESYFYMPEDFKKKDVPKFILPERRDIFKQLIYLLPAYNCFNPKEVRFLKGGATSSLLKHLWNKENFPIGGFEACDIEFKGDPYDWIMSASDEDKYKISVKTTNKIPYKRPPSKPCKNPNNVHKGTPIQLKNLNSNSDRDLFRENEFNSLCVIVMEEGYKTLSFFSSSTVAYLLKKNLYYPNMDKFNYLFHI